MIVGINPLAKNPYPAIKGNCLRERIAATIAVLFLQYLMNPEIGYYMPGGDRSVFWELFLCAGAPAAIIIPRVAKVMWLAAARGEVAPPPSRQLAWLFSFLVALSAGVAIAEGGLACMSLYDIPGVSFLQMMAVKLVLVVFMGGAIRDNTIRRFTRLERDG